MSEGEEQDEAQKTEDPTPKKLEEARKQGNIPLSREVNNWLMLLAGTVVVAMFSPYILRELTNVLKVYIEKSYAIPGTPGGMKIALGDGTLEVMAILAFPMLIFVLAAFFGPFSQVGPLFAPKSIKPSLSKISPLKGFKRLFSMRSLMEFAKGIAKMALVSVVGVVILYPFYQGIEHIIDIPVVHILDEMRVLVLRLMIGVLIIMGIVALIDVVYQRNEHTKKMRMTKQEVKDEYKQTEGDPMIKGKLRQLRSEKARQRMMQAVPQADVVITNPTHYSIALKYDPDTMEAPLCLAKGVDEVALRIREVAKEHEIVLYENVPLARALYDTVEIDETIPQEHFKAVAEAISYVFKLRKGMKR
ncbi:MAG: flagellar biosynthesis protein FlhB [Micavibrio sp.]|nr:flagellar biosynthesis protein FlhB [Micavibrio sp.]|tara:strand:- start:12890 stop:13969 length:1080 start_codon:yes stop_codon:yes gene_type:complete